eukprot:COSAG02_NODE_48189_length_335_cov_1.097458_1_plen_57_part_10
MTTSVDSQGQHNIVRSWPVELLTKWTTGKSVVQKWGRMERTCAVQPYLLHMTSRGHQ